jgi:hypothetical protein
MTLNKLTNAISTLLITGTRVQVELLSWHGDGRVALPFVLLHCTYNYLLQVTGLFHLFAGIDLLISQTGIAQALKMHGVGNLPLALPNQGQEGSENQVWLAIGCSTYSQCGFPSWHYTLPWELW